MGRWLRSLRRAPLQRRFRRDGYVVVPALGPEQVRRAIEVYERHDPGELDGAYSSLHGDDAEHRRQIDRELQDCIWPALDAHLADHRPLIAALSVKRPTGDSVFPVHQDWNTMDEELGTGITCWLPLTPVTAREGLMQVLPGSHRVVDCLRGSPSFPVPYDHEVDRIRRELMVDLHVEPGQALIMSGRLLHMTDQNRSASVRLAAVLSAVPSSAQALHWFRDADGRVEGYWVEAPFFTDFHIGERPPGTPFRVIERYEPTPVGVADLARARRGAPWR